MNACEHIVVKSFLLTSWRLMDFVLGVGINRIQHDKKWIDAFRRGSEKAFCQSPLTELWCYNPSTLNKWNLKLITWRLASILCPLLFKEKEKVHFIRFFCIFWWKLIQTLQKLCWSVSNGEHLYLKRKFKNVHSLKLNTELNIYFHSVDYLWITFRFAGRVFEGFVAALV